MYILIYLLGNTRFHVFADAVAATGKPMIISTEPFSLVPNPGQVFLLLLSTFSFYYHFSKEKKYIYHHHESHLNKILFLKINYLILRLFQHHFFLL